MLLLELERIFTSINSSILYCPGSTILFLDDDHLRMSSRFDSETTPLRITNNPEKALGPVQNAVCSALTGCYLAVHHIRIGENLQSFWEILMCRLQGVPSSPSLREMTDVCVAADRGYSSGSVDEFLNTHGATFFRTHNRSLDCPFFFGNSAISKRHKGMNISESGLRAVYSASKRGPQCSVAEAIVYRESARTRNSCHSAQQSSAFWIQ